MNIAQITSQMYNSPFAVNRWSYTDPVVKGGESNAIAEYGKTNPMSETFGNILSKALKELDSLQKTASNKVVDLAVGNSNNIQDAVISMQKADLGLTMAIEVRNKIVEAYQEIMRMNV